MEEYTIYRNMKRWLFLYGYKLLDLLLPVFNERSELPTERYANLSERFDKHFNLLAYYTSQVSAELPLVLVSFEDLTGNHCFKKMIITFDVYFQTIAPSDCKDDIVHIQNSPEAMLNFQRIMNEYLCEMVYNMGEDMRATSFDDKPWSYPINYNVINQRYDSLNGIARDEILHFQTAFTLEDNETCC